jgi:glyoxylase-like metal-dependent hydrolase (beta-lactamase superfamily II)
MRTIVLILTLAFVFPAPGYAQSTSAFADIAKWRLLVAADQDLPTQVRVEVVKRDTLPYSFVHEGGDNRPFVMARSAFQLCGVKGCVVLDAGYDAELANKMGTANTFDAASWARIQKGLSSAAVVAVTHEHPDHMAGLARHPDPKTFVSKLVLTPEQYAGLAQYAPKAGLAPALIDYQPQPLPKPRRIAPGLVMIPAAGHTPGSVMFFQRMNNGVEILFIGDVGWALADVVENKSRPESTLARMVTPDDRVAVLTQIAALHALHAAESKLIILPSHDDAYLLALIGAGTLVSGFR